MKPEWNELKKYVGKWVAVVDEKIVASGDTGMDVYKEAKKYTDVPLIFQVSDPDEIYTVDSGATTGIFNTDIAKSLCIDYKKGEKRYPMGISGHILTYLNKIEIEIADICMLYEIDYGTILRLNIY